MRTAGSSLGEKAPALKHSCRVPGAQRSTAEEAAIILKALKDLKAVEGNALGGDLTSDGATDLMAFGPRRAGTNNANGFRAQERQRFGQILAQGWRPDKI